jgi:hypothetical protein
LSFVLLLFFAFLSVLRGEKNSIPQTGFGLTGIYGSPVKNSNADRLVQTVLHSTGFETEFIKLSKRKIQGCIACMGCTDDNICSYLLTFFHATIILQREVLYIPAASAVSGRPTGRPYLNDTMPQGY